MGKRYIYFFVDNYVSLGIKWGKVGIVLNIAMNWRTGCRMFMGEYHPSLDEKGRVAVPVQAAKAFGENAVINRLIITHGFDKCIMAFREEDWKEFVEKACTPFQADPKNRKRIRFLLGGACDCELDRQGRIMIPAYLRSTRR